MPITHIYFIALEWIALVSCWIVGVYYILLYGNSSFSGVTLKALTATIPTLRFGFPVTNLTAGSGKRMLFKLLVPYSATFRLLVIILSGGSGNADLFVGQSYVPTTVSYHWSSSNNNNEDEVKLYYFIQGMDYFFVICWYQIMFKTV